MNTQFATLAFVGIMLCASTAVGQDKDSGEVAAPPSKTRFVSVTFSPIHLPLRILELTGEFALSEEFGVAAILGAGRQTTRYVSGDVQSPLFEIGVQGAYYAIGDFDHGLQLGAEALMIHVSSDSPDDVYTTTGQRYFVGPIVGYKFVASFGLTLFIQLGLQYTVASYQIPDGASVAVDDYSGPFGLGNFNLGWSF